MSGLSEQGTIVGDAYRRALRSVHAAAVAHAFAASRNRAQQDGTAAPVLLAAAIVDGLDGEHLVLLPPARQLDGHLVALLPLEQGLAHR